MSTSRLVLALCYLALCSAPTASNAAEDASSHAKHSQDSFSLLLAGQLWPWQVSNHRELGTSRVLLDTEELAAPGRSRSFIPGSCDPSAVSCTHVLPGPAVNSEQAHPGRPPGVEAFDGPNNASERVILLAVLVAIGFLVLICIVIGLYYTWLRIHYSGCDSEGVYKASATGSSKEATAVATAQPRQPFPPTQPPSANKPAFFSLNSASASHMPSMPQGYPPTAPTAQNVCQNCAGSGFDTSNFCSACPYGTGSTFGATGDWSHQQQVQAAAWQQSNSLAAQLQLQPIPQGEIIQEQRAAQLPAGSPQLRRAGSPVSSIQSQSTQGAAPSNPTIGSMMDRDLYPPTPSGGGTQATSVRGYPNSQPSSYPQLHRQPQDSTTMSSLPSGMDLAPTSAPASGPAPPHPGQPGSLVKAASTPESGFKPRLPFSTYHSTQNLVLYKTPHASEGPSQPSSQGAPHRPSSFASQPIQTHSKNGTITIFPQNGALSSRTNSYGNSQHSPGGSYASHASAASPHYGAKPPTPTPPHKIQSRFTNDAVAAMPGGSTMSTVTTSDYAPGMLQAPAPVASRPESSYSSARAGRSGRSGTFTPGNGNLTPAQLTSMDGSEGAAALSPSMSKNGLSSLAPVDMIEESRVLTNAAVKSEIVHDDTDSSPVSSAHVKRAAPPSAGAVPSAPPFHGHNDTGLVIAKTAQLNTDVHQEMFMQDGDEDTRVNLSNAISGDTAVTGSGKYRQHTGRTRHLWVRCKMHQPVRTAPSQSIPASQRQNTENTSSAESKATCKAISVAVGYKREEMGSRMQVEACSEGEGDAVSESPVDTPFDSAAHAAAAKEEPGGAREPPLVDTDNMDIPSRSNPSSCSPLTVVKRKSQQLNSDSDRSGTTAGTKGLMGTPSRQRNESPSSGTYGSITAPVDMHSDKYAEPTEPRMLGMHPAAASIVSQSRRERSRTSSTLQHPASQTTLTGELGHGRRGPYDVISPTTSSAVPTGSGPVRRCTDTNTVNTVMEISNPIDELRTITDMHEDIDTQDREPMSCVAPSSARASVPGGLSVGGFSGVSALGEVGVQVLGDLNTAFQSESAGVTAPQTSQPSQVSSLNLTQSELYVKTFMRAHLSQDCGSQAHAHDGISHSSARVSDTAVAGGAGSTGSVASGPAYRVVAPTAAGLQSRAREFANDACSNTMSADVCITRMVHPASSCAVDVAGASGAIDEEKLAGCEPPVATIHDMYGPHAPLGHAAAEDLDINMELDGAVAPASPTSDSQTLPPPPSMTSALLTDSGACSATRTPVAAPPRSTMNTNAVYGASTCSTPGTTDRLPVRGMHAITPHSNTAPSAPLNAFTTDAEVDAYSHAPDLTTSDLEQHPYTAPNVPHPLLQSYPLMHGAGGNSDASKQKPLPNHMARPSGLPPRPGPSLPARISEVGIAASPASHPRHFMNLKGPDAALTVSLEALDSTSAMGISGWEVASLLDALGTTNTRISGRFTLLGPMHRRLSGQGVVEFAVGCIAPAHSTSSFQKNKKHMHGRREVGYNDTAEEDAVAIKFYIVHAAFDRVASLWSQPPIRRLMTALVDVIPQGPPMDVPVLPPSNNLPGSGPGNEQEGEPVEWKQIETLPMVVMKRGTTLDEWARRERPSLPMILTALVDMCEHLRELHACGYVYYALKPSNVVWLEEDRKWHLADFGCASRSGVHAGLSFSLNYAAPELIAAQALGSRTILSDPSADIWALGVTAYELLLGKKAFRGLPPHDIKAALLGEKCLPWEEPSDKVEPGGRLSSLPNLHTSIMLCLCRMAERRPSADEMAGIFFNLLEFSSQKHTVVHPS